MTDEIPDSAPNPDALTPEELKFFDSRGETELPGSPSDKTLDSNDKDANVSRETLSKTEDKEPEVQKLVPHGAFEEERQRRKQWQAEAQREREETARLRGQLEALTVGKKPEGLTSQEKADWDKDPIAAGKALQAKLDAQEEAGKTRQAEMQQFQNIKTIGQRHAERFAKQQPHFFDSQGADGKPVQGAYTFLRAAEAKKLVEQYPGESLDRIVTTVDLQELNRIQECARDGVNAAERVWELALEAGYKPPQAAALKPPEKSEAEKVADQEAAQRSSRSLSSIAGGGGEAELSIEALANMDDAEFAAATSGEKWEKMHRKGVI